MQRHPRALLLLGVVGLFASVPAFGQLPPPPVPTGNPITPEKTVLGKILFWEEQLSSDNTIACGTCHIPAAGGAEARPMGIDPGLDGVTPSRDDKHGSFGVIHSEWNDTYSPSATFGLDLQVTPRNTQSFIGAQYFLETFWDGRASDTFFDPVSGEVSLQTNAALESQAVGPLLSSVEMANHGRTWGQITSKLAASEPLALASSLTPDIVSALALDPTYPDLFEAAFGTPDVTAERIAFAIATYERALIPDQTPFDLGQLTPEQADGEALFIQRCYQCHPGPLFSDNSFRNIGVRPIAEDNGREEVTGNSVDAGRFRVPSLRNVGLRHRYFHNGQETDLGGVVDFYARGGDFSVNQDPLMIPFTLSDQKRSALIAFLESLTDRRVALELPPFDRPTLFSEVTPANPRVLDGGSPGSGGLVPQMIAVNPPKVGLPGFKIGIGGALGGARAYLRMSLPESVHGANGGTTWAAHSTVIRGQVLNGTGAGAGYGTHFLDLSPGWEGRTVHVQWIVVDPGAPGGIARSQVAEVTLF